MEKNSEDLQKYSKANNSGELKNTSYELFIGALSILSIINIALLYFGDPELTNVILIMNGFFSFIFIADFLFRLFTSSSKSNYFFHQMGWIDLLASIPLPQLKILRLFRVLRVYSLMKIYGGSRLLKEFISNRGGSALLVLIFIMILILEFGGLAMLYLESNVPGANITDASDAIWYVYVTITTVGYGDQYPVSNTGRILGIVIMTVGVGLFGTITAFLANIFIPPEADEASEPETPAVDFAELSAQVNEIKQLLQAYDQTNNHLMAKLEGIETILQKSNS